MQTTANAATSIFIEHFSINRRLMQFVNTLLKISVYDLLHSLKYKSIIHCSSRGK